MNTWLLSLFLLLACNREFDEPPMHANPDIEANCTIARLKALHRTAGTVHKVQEDWVISGIVVADDRTGNFYKSIVLQDSSGGITLRLEGSNLYTMYPVGRRLFVRVKGLYLGDYGGLMQLGGGIDASDPGKPELTTIPAALLDVYIVKAETGNIIDPRIVTPLELGTGLQDSILNTPVQLENIEFGINDTAKTYADPSRALSALSFTMRNCKGQSIILRSSSFAGFAAVNLPNGNGSIRGIYTVFNRTKQLVIRDTSDLRLINIRCK